MQRARRQQAVEAAHRRGKPAATSGKRRVGGKKRDIRTSFRKTVAPCPEPPLPGITLPGHAALSEPQPQQRQQAPGQLSATLIASPGSSAGTTDSTWPGAALALTALGGEPSAADAAVAAAAAATQPQHSSQAAGAAAGLWAAADEAGGIPAATAPLASLSALDRVLDGLVVSSSRSSSASASNAISSSSEPRGTHSTRPMPAAAATGSMAARPAPPGPAAAGVADVACEADWEHEVAAATAAGQLLVVKVEPSRPTGLLGGAQDASLRFQHHGGLPSAVLGTYAPHPELHAAHGYARLARASPSGSAGAGFGGAASFGLGSAGGSAALLGLPGLAAALGEPAAAPGGLGSSLHSWYCSLASSYAAAGAVTPPPLRFLSLQSDSRRAKALCRRLGVSAGLCALLVEPGSGRKLLEVCGTKIQQQLPAALLYFAGVDADGCSVRQLVSKLDSRAALEAFRSRGGVSAVAFHVRGAPPCVRDYAALCDAARAHAQRGVAFAVMDVDASAECGELAAELGVARLPAVLVFDAAGCEAGRLASAEGRHGLDALLAQLLPGGGDNAGGSVAE